MNRAASLSRRRLLLAAAASAIAGCAPRPRSADAGSAGAIAYRFVNGTWFDGTRFRPRTVYAVGGRFTDAAPGRIDRTIDLAHGHVVPPFADAHTHHFDNPSNIADHVAMYLRDGVFYAKVQTDVRSRARLVADRVNRPDSVDVSYAHGGLTASNGHPIETYEGLALFGRPSARGVEEVRQLRASRLRDNDAYYVIDTAADLERKWPDILAGRPDFIKIYLLFSEDYETRRQRTDTVGDRGMDPNLVAPIVARAHAAGLRVSAHVNTAADYRAALAGGVDEMAHMPGVSMAADIEPERYWLTQADARETARRGVPVVPAPLHSPTLDPQSPAFNPASRARMEPVRRRNLALLKRAGAPFAFGSDGFGRSPVRDVLYLATLGVFDNRELLKIWCEDTPRTIFPGRRIGTLADGCEASFLVLDGDPLENLDQVRNIRLRFKQGDFIAAGP